jgi:hypothetical protein
MMTRAVAPSTTIICAAPTEIGEDPATRAYLLRKPFAAVHFEPAGNGRIVFLPEGAELRVTGSSRLCDCFEVLYQDQLYNIFKIDLLGPWATPAKATPAKAIPAKLNPIKPIRALAAVGACA